LERRERGLPSINQARAERRRALVLGKVKIGGLPPHFWLWAATVLGAIMVIYWRVEAGKVESAKSQVMAKQRAVAVMLGPQIIPFRDRVEAWAKELSGDYKGDVIEPDASLGAISKEPGVYLRLRLGNARSTKELRTAALQSLRDGFTSCLFVSKAAPNQADGPRCRTTSDCDAGLMCNEWDVCIEPSSPFNLRLAYRALRVLSSDWTDELHAATSVLQINAYERDLEKVTKHDVPIAAKLLVRSRYFTLVLDEDPPAGLPAELPDAGETPTERVQRTSHFARVGIWELASGRQLVRLRATAGGEFVPVGKRVIDAPEVVAAQQRQVNSCALALALKAKLHD
jgi:hypothetical protein